MNSFRTLSLAMAWLACIFVSGACSMRVLDADLPALEVGLVALAGGYTTWAGFLLPVVVPEARALPEAPVALLALSSVVMVTALAAGLVYRQGDLAWAFAAGVSVQGAVVLSVEVLSGAWRQALLLGVLLAVPVVPTLTSVVVLLYGVVHDTRPWNAAHYALLVWIGVLWAYLWPWERPRRSASVVRAVVMTVLTLTCVPMGLSEVGEGDLRPLLITVIGLGVPLSLGAWRLFDRLDPPEQ